MPRPEDELHQQHRVDEGNVLYDVGTLTATSGKRLGGKLTGLDTPTLRGIALGKGEKNDLVAYLKQLD